MRAAATPGLRPRSDLAITGAALSAFVLVLAVAALRFGLVGLAVPLALVLGAVLLRYPGTTLVLALTAVILAEDADFGLFPQTAKLYTNLVKGITPVDVLILIAIAGVAWRLLAEARPLRLPPRPLALTSLLVAVGLASGVLVGKAAGVPTTHALLASHTFLYVIVVPLLLVNLGLDEQRIAQVLAGALALGLVKAILGLAAVALGRGPMVNGSSVLTYYAPTANWLMTVAVLTVAAAVVLRVRPSWWTLAIAGAMLLSLALSYRRSFWIADALGLVLVLLLGLAAARVRLVIPVLAVLGIGVWLLGGVALQSDTPLAERVQSLAPSKVTATADDRYRLDERANVLAEIRHQPITGLGLEVPWRAIARPLPVEVNPTHTYVHFAALLWWLKLGILGLLAYLGLLVSGMWLSVRAWRVAHTPLLRAFGLGSLCSLIGLVAIESTATFTGTDLRFTLLLSAQLGLLAVIGGQPERDAEERVAG